MRISDWSSDVCSSDLLRLHISLVAIDIQHHRPRLDLSFEPLEGRLCRGGRIFVPASTVLPRHETVPRCINRHFGCRKPASCRIAQRQNERFPGPASLRIETATDTMPQPSPSLPEVTPVDEETGRASGRERGCHDVYYSVVACQLKKK